MSAKSNTKHYIAFISYSTADEKWAKWLWYQLEYYPVPSNLRKEYPQIPKYLRPIFWYKQDLSGTHLEKSLHRELDDSQYLIVICSPSSAKSEWVNKEILRFIELGRTNKIIPFIIQGTPHATNPADECFPPALRDLPQEQEIRGIDVRRAEGKQHAFIDVVATILEVRFNELWQRHQRRRRKLLRRVISIAILLLLFLAMLIAYKMPRIEYYADYVDKWGLPTGVVPITKHEKEHSHRSYMFTYRRTPLSEYNPLQWRLERVAYINSLDIPTEHDNVEYVKRSAIMFLKYSEQTGALTQIQYANADEEILYRQDISKYNSIPGAIADFKAAAEDLGSGFAASNLARMEKVNDAKISAIKRYAYQRDQNGFYTQITFHSNNDDDLESSKVCDINGIYGANFKRDSLGRIIEVIYIDKNGEITCTKKGVAGYQYTYDNYGSVNSQLYFDMEHKPILNEQKWAYCVEQTNQYGNTCRCIYYNEEGLICNTVGGYAQYTYEYDELGNKIRQAFYDTDTMPCLNKVGIAGWTAKYNDLGWRIEESYFDVDGKPCIHQREKYASKKCKYTVLGKCTEEAYFNTNGQPCNNRFGYSKEVNKYNLLKQCVQTTYFDTLSRPMNYRNCHMIKRKYDEYNNCIEETFYDTEGKPCTFSSYAKDVVKWRGVFNALGYITAHELYDVNDQMVGRTMIKYDIKGNSIEFANYGRDGQLKKFSKRVSYARCTSAYDKRGNCIEQNYYNENNQLFLYKNQYATYKFTYDDRGNIVQKAYYDTHGDLICINQQYALQKLQYDERGNCIKKANYNNKQQLCLDVNGVSIYHYDYDNRGNVLAEVFYDQNYAPIMNKEGYAKAHYEYDIRNNCTKAIYYDNKGRVLKQPQ